ncbi:diguanylate cyclase domain-containing protein [Phormidium sp. CCY1219]|uniref:diguanylate cyclase domain-containing protein n=1 Tax=Phormidium sp. CCY1219 TaxID=2886104 RepID=UPI002D1F4722|nr:diguanylate cyclase [Phormidium sp. CCY1219]MEB3828038.1 diguanylate cyclase [Phormidium sp. CCY1219]
MTGEKFLREKQNILIVDDTATNLILLTHILNQHNYKVRVAKNGKLALQSVKIEPPDLILLDIKMPDINGYEVCKQLKSQESTRAIPVIFISALDATLDKIEAFNLGGVDYITKPFEPIEVLVRVESQLRLRQIQVQLENQNAELQLLLTATQALANSADIDAAFGIILSQTCQTMQWQFGEAWMPSAEKTSLKYRQAWYAGEGILNEFCRHSQTFHLSLGEGLAGRVWRSQKMEWVKNIGYDSGEHLSRARLATLAGLKGALGVPILVQNSQNQPEVLAILVFFMSQDLQPSGRSLQLIDALARQLGSMIQRKHAEAALKQANLELNRLVNLDSLTQVANRRRFDEYLSQVWTEMFGKQQPISLVLFDLDYFKRYNDYYGHQAGDECLQQVALAAKEAMRNAEDLLARYGGEEFAAILPNTPREEAIALAQTIRDRVKQLQLSHPDSIVNSAVTLSLGVASTIPACQNSPEQLIATADEALYAAKNQGRDRMIFLERLQHCGQKN